MIPQNQVQLPTKPLAVASMIHEAYHGNLSLFSLTARARPFICPFEDVLSRIKTVDSLLDVGCGIGIMSILAARCGLAKNVLGIDISPRAIRFALRAKNYSRSKVDFAVVKEQQWPNKLFNAVISIDVLHHVQPTQKNKFIKQLCDKVKPGGQLVIKDISPRPRWKAWANWTHDLIISNQNVQYVSENNLKNQLVQEGLAVNEITRLDRLWYGHYLISATKHILN